MMGLKFGVTSSGVLLLRFLGVRKTSSRGVGLG